MLDNIIVALIAVIGVLFTAIVTLYNFNKNIRVEQITKERTKWREEIRRISRELVSLDYVTKDPDKLLIIEQKKISLLSELEIRLNPYDNYDVDILRYANKELFIQENREAFLLAISFLLKQDWEVVKNESSFLRKFRKIPRVDIMNYQKNKSYYKINICYLSFLILGGCIAIYFFSLNSFCNYIPEAFRISISNAAIITAIYISLLYGISRRYKIKTNLIDGYKPTYCVALAVLLNYFLLYENGDMDRAIASGLMIFATSMLVTMLTPKD